MFSNHNFKAKCDIIEHNFLDLYYALSSLNMFYYFYFFLGKVVVWKHDFTAREIMFVYFTKRLFSQTMSFLINSWCHEWCMCTLLDHLKKKKIYLIFYMVLVYMCYNVWKDNLKYITSLFGIRFWKYCR